MAEGKTEASVGDLLSTLARDTGVLVRQEFQLATTEMTIKARRVSRNTGLIAVGGAVTIVGSVGLLIALIVALGAVLALWLAALLVGAVVTSIGYAVVKKGLSGLRSIDPLPEQTLGTLNADVAWAKEQIR